MSRVVSPALPYELMPALRVLFGRRAVPERESCAVRYRDALTYGDRDPTEIFVTRDGAGRLCGAVLVQVLPGALGVLSPPGGESPPDLDALTATACDWLRSRGVKVCQAFATVDEKPDMPSLERGGFRHVTQLVFMRRELSQPSCESPTGPLAIMEEPRPHSPGFRATLLATYESTRDCPELNGGRTPDELLAGVTEPTPGTDSYLATCEEGAVGVLMLSAIPELGTIDLTYVGITAVARSRGFGSELLKFSLAEAWRVRAAALTLSVDVRNVHALRLYHRHGFIETDRRDVWLAHF